MKHMMIALALALPLAVAAQDTTKTAPAEPKHNVISTYRILPKPGHQKELEAALKAHAEKFHHGDVAWRVGEILSGPDGGMYQIVEGPSSWTALDDRGDLGAEHMKDYAMNIEPHVEKATPDSFATFQEGLSTVGMTQWSTKTVTVHLVIKPGRGVDAYDNLKKWKTIYEKAGVNVAVWHGVFSGESSYAIVFRLKNGFKDFDGPNPFRKACDALYGTNEWARLNLLDEQIYSKITTELVEYKPDLSSK